MEHKVETYLKLITKGLEVLTPRSDIQGMTVCRFVLEKGIAMQKIPGTRYLPRKPKKHCYENCHNSAVEDERWIYCEGYAFSGIIPCPHAWLINHMGEVFDPTWEDDREEKCEYWGIAFKTSFIKKQKEYGIIDDFKNRWPIFGMSERKYRHPIMNKLSVLALQKTMKENNVIVTA